MLLCCSVSRCSDSEYHINQHINEQVWFSGMLDILPVSVPISSLNLFILALIQTQIIQFQIISRTTIKTMLWKRELILPYIILCLQTHSASSDSLFKHLHINCASVENIRWYSWLKVETIALLYGFVCRSLNWSKSNTRLTRNVFCSPSPSRSSSDSTTVSK